VNRDGSDLHAVTAVDDNAAYPVWSPDNSRIVFQSGGKEYFADASKRGKQQNLVALPPFEGLDGYLRVSSWSRDGKWLAGVRLSTSDAELWIYSIETQKYEKLFDGPVSKFSPQWLSDNNQLFFVTGTQRPHAYILDRTSRKTTELMLPFSPTLAFAPDDHTVFSVAGQTTADVWVMSQQ
jgi:Tol biopolymer transport system component